MKRRIISIITSLTIIMSVGFVMPASTQAAGATVVKLNPAAASPFNNGEFEGWGTSLCWWANRVGYSPELVEAAADAFFSEEGLGLDIARYNLGGGDDPAHSDPTADSTQPWYRHITRSDSMVPGVWDEFTLTNNGQDVTITYDITKDQNQLNMALAALGANPDLYFEGFSNSAPYFMTNSGCTSGAADASKNNLKDDMYDDFAKFIADATLLFKQAGIEFKSYSPMNEPYTDYWGANSIKQEGCHFDQGASESKMLVETRKALDAKGLTDVIVAGLDETSIDTSITSVDALTAEGLAALGRLDTHTYSGSRRAQLKAKAIEKNKKLWMSEVDDGGAGEKLAEMIITDMNGMQPAAWVMWDIVDVHKDSSFSNKNGGGSEANNIKGYTDGLWGVGYADHDDKTLHLTNKYYSFGQFSKYITPGDTIIASSNNTLAAYNKESGDIKIVANNTGNNDLPYEFDLSGFVNVGDEVTEIRSTMNTAEAESEKWAEIEDEATLEGKKLNTTLKAHTITTYVISGNTPIEHYAVFSDEGDEIRCGKSVQLGVQSDVSGAVTWSVDNNELAEISSSGVLKTKKPGKVTVTASIGGVLSATKNYNIVLYADIVGPASVSMGKAVQLVADTNAEGTPQWSVDDENIATIDSNGVLTGVSAGTVNVTVKIGETVGTKEIRIKMYTLSGTPSWGNEKTAPSDNDDYLKAVDNNVNTAFDGLKEGWVMYDYGTPYKIVNVKLAPRKGYASRTVGGKVQGSNDAFTWTDLYTITSALTEGTLKTVEASSMENNNAYRYFRYTNPTDYTNISEFQIEAVPAAAAKSEPIVEDIEEMTDDFEGSSNIFGAEMGDMSMDGNQVYACPFARFGNVFMPIKSEARVDLKTPIKMGLGKKFRISFNMFSGWEDSGKNNEFSLQDSNGNEIVGFLISGGGYNLNQMRIGGTDLLADVSSKPVFQCLSTAVKNNALRGANGWDHKDQPYGNNMGLNKTVEIIIDGETGDVSVTMSGGAANLSYTGTVGNLTDIKSLVINGNYNASRGRTVTYDNFDADVIKYPTELKCVKITAKYNEFGVLSEVIKTNNIKMSEITDVVNTPTEKVFYWETLESMKPVEIN